MVMQRSEIWLINLEPTLGSEMSKLRPCVIVSPDEANKYLHTVIAAPLTSTIRNYPSRLPCVFKRKKGQIAVDQLRSLDKSRFIKKAGKLDDTTTQELLELIRVYFE
ncbi:MAG: type II toxin-antitoxin system PemK/MazF family toxin [Bacteroidota bacterium]